MITRRNMLLGVASLTVSDYAATETLTKLVGETAALFGTTPRKLLHPIRRILAAYSFDAKGQRIDYSPNQDFVQVGDAIARTSGSDIYDFHDYKVILLPAGKFEWIDSPRHPPRTLTLQIYVDYETDKFDRAIPALASFPIEGKLLIAGDSIAGGTDTIASFPQSSGGYSFGALLQKHINGIEVAYASQTGGDVSLFEETIDRQLNERPQIVLFEFGMNDHLHGFKNLERFGMHLLNAVGAFRRIGTNALLIGFPQQNSGWNKEIPEATIAYNESIENVARITRSPFIDIFSAFQKLGVRKNINLELFGDGLHHPNNFGHKVYFSEILPYVLSSPTTSTDIGPDFICIPPWSAP